MHLTVSVVLPSGTTPLTSVPASSLRLTPRTLALMPSQRQAALATTPGPARSRRLQ